MSNPTGAYIGSLSDIYPVLQLPHIKTWIYVDSLPLSEGPDSQIYFELSEDPEEDLRLKKDPELRQNFFFKEWDNHFLQCNFNRTLHDPDNSLLVYTNNDQTIYFFYNTLFPQTKNKLFYTMLQNANNIYLSGFSPHQKILQYVSYPLNLYVSSNISALPNSDEDDIRWFLYRNIVKDINYTYIQSKKSYKTILEDVQNTKLISTKNLYDIYQIQLEENAEQNEETVRLWGIDEPLIYSSGRLIHFKC